MYVLKASRSLGDSARTSPVHEIRGTVDGHELEKEDAEALYRLCIGTTDNEMAEKELAARVALRAGVEDDPRAQREYDDIMKDLLGG